MLNKLTIKNGGFRIENSIINDLLDIINVNSNLSINNSELKKALRINTLDGDIVLQTSVFFGFVDLWNVKCPFHVILDENTFKNTFRIRASKIEGLFIHGNSFDKIVEFENSHREEKTETYCNEIFITEANFSEGAIFKGFSKGIDKITISLSPSLKGLLNFEDWNTKTFEMRGVNESLKLLLKNINFQITNINNFSNYGDISFDKCRGSHGSVLQLTNCNFGPAIFNEFDFTSFQEIKFDNITLDNIQAYNVNWFKDETFVYSGVKEEKNQNFKRKREVYKQIKHALKKNGNQIESLEFKAREVEAYQRELKQNTSAKYQDKFILWFSKSNNFGLSWWKPTWIIFLITLAFYFVVHPIFNDNLDYTIAKSEVDLMYTLKELWSNSKVFWQLFNPTRRFSSVYGDSNNTVLYALDLLHRIILGAFIFQIIRGFRKYAEK